MGNFTVRIKFKWHEEGSRSLCWLQFRLQKAPWLGATELIVIDLIPGGCTTPFHRRVIPPKPDKLHINVRGECEVEAPTSESRERR